ncbi:MAG: transposase [Flavobacteriales bacterium Tduv]
MIHWKGRMKEIKKIYQSQGIKGQPTYSRISLFKMRLLSYWYDLSDVGMEEFVKEPLSFMRFCCFRLEDQIPDHTTLFRFRNEIVAKKTYECLLKKINKELEKHQAIVKTGVIVDVSITERLLAPKGTSTYVVEDQKKEGGQSKKSKGKKRSSIRIRQSRKMAQ